MKIHVLGSGAYPLRWEDGRSLSLLLPDHELVIDGGIGLTAIPEDYSTKKLTIILSHYHHDHILGLPFLANILERGKIGSVAIMGDERIKQLGLLFQEPFNPSYTSEQMPITMDYLPEKYEINGLTIKRKQVPHATGSSNYFIISDGKTTLAFGTDTTADVANAEFISGADALIHECNFDNAHTARAIAEGHSYPDAVSKLARAANIETVHLIHTDPRFPNIESEVQEKTPKTRTLHDDQVLII